MSKEIFKVYGAELNGIKAELIEIEADFNVGLHSFNIVGLADKAVSEAKERINSALKNSGIKPPTRENRKITINLAPADIKKTGSHFDLPMALSYLLASNQIKTFETKNKLFAGELALNGDLRPVSGILNMALLAQKIGFEEFYVPKANVSEAAIVKNIKIFGISNLTEIIQHLEKTKILKPESAVEIIPIISPSQITMDDIKGQQNAKRALLIAASGAHNVLFSGPPGTGKTMLAEALLSILPPPSYEEIIEMTEIWSAAGMLGNENFINFRPFRAPHHTSSLVAIIGGGNTLKPGEISLAHRGVLFLDELPEFHRDVLEALRQPLEGGKISIARAKNSVEFPARFMLVAAKNPCPCGYFGDTEKECICSANSIFRYNKKISGPLLDRIDIQINVPRLKAEELVTPTFLKNQNEANQMRNQVLAARQIQRERFKVAGLNILTNSEAPSKNIEDLMNISKNALSLAKNIVEKNFISGRGYFRTLKVARTIADLENAAFVTEQHILEAFQYRVRETSN